MPTIIELIAPKDFVYYSIGKSLTENFYGVNYALYITHDSIGNANVSLNDSELENYINYVRAVSYWIAKFGTDLK